MQKQKPIIDQSLSERADERERAGNWRTAATFAAGLVNVPGIESIETASNEFEFYETQFQLLRSRTMRS